MSTLAEKVSEQLRLAILAGELAPGSSLREEQLAMRLQVSRIPVREALRTLKGQGLLLHRSHAGMVVRPQSRDDAVEIWEIRNLIEPAAIQWSIEKMTHSHIEDLIQIVEEMRREERAEEWIKLREKFIYEIYTPMNRPLIRSLIMQLNTLSGQYLYAGDNHQRNRMAGNAFAEKMIEFCSEKDAEGAVFFFYETTNRMLQEYQFDFGQE